MDKDNDEIIIDGQMGIEELYVRDFKEEEEEILKPIEGQIPIDFKTNFKKSAKIKKLTKDFKNKKIFKKNSEENKTKIKLNLKLSANEEINFKKKTEVKDFNEEMNKTEGKILNKNKPKKNQGNLVEKHLKPDKLLKTALSEDEKETKNKSIKQNPKTENKNAESKSSFTNKDSLNKEVFNSTETRINDGEIFLNSDEVENVVKSENVRERDFVGIEEKIFSEDSGEDVVDGMLYRSLDRVLHDSMIPYSEHVILDRALPRVEDGLKPVQRRILYSMMELGVTPDKPFRKSARIVGDCMGKYHPHGDKSVYDAMVRMAQPFNTNVLLVSGHGNFGSIDGDGAAAMRYTEARLAPLAMELLRDLDKNTVKWGLNFDDSLKEPEILPGRFPNLLVNGSTGIAVGLATNIPPHNLGEVIDGVIMYMANPRITLKEMLKIIKGPDFPTGGYILNNSEINQAYQTGRGRIFLRAKMHIESNDNDKRYIVITELPYQVNKASLLQKIAGFREENKHNLGGISEIRDESDREGLRAVIRIKKDADIKSIYASLLKNTELQGTFGINMVAIANGKPKQMGLLDVISYYAEYQREIIFRRSRYELEQAKEREHILAGLIIAIKNIDAVVKIIKSSQNPQEAKKRLREKFVLSEKQAQAILDMRLARLTSLEVNKLEEELKKIRELIKDLTAIVSSKKLQFQIVKDELLQIKKIYKTDRKTKILKVEETLQFVAEAQAPSLQVVIVKNALGNFKCINQRQYNFAQKDFKENSTLFEVHTLKFKTDTSKTVLAFSNFGNCFKINVKDFTESRYKDKGINEKIIFKGLKTDETIVALFDFEITSSKDNLIFMTKMGMIKKTLASEYGLLKSNFQAVKLRENDQVLNIQIEPLKYTVLFVSKSGMVLNAENKDIPVQGRISGGVKGIKLSNKDFCVGAEITDDEGELLVVSDKGFAKRVLVSNIDVMARYRKGLKIMGLAGENGKNLIFAKIVKEPLNFVFVDNADVLCFRNSDLIPIETRIGKGKPVDRLKKKLDLINVFECYI